MKDVSSVVDAFASGDASAIESAAKKIRDEKIELNREQLQSEIGAVRHTTFMTSWMPQKPVESCYPAGYFGQERFPHWVDPNCKIQGQNRSNFQSANQ